MVLISNNKTMRLIIFFLLLSSFELNAQDLFFATSKNAGSSYSAEYTGILNYLSGEGIAEPNETQKTAGNNLCNCLISGGWWNEFDWLHVSLGASSESMANDVNWVDPGNVTNFSENGTITWVTNDGWETNGSSYLSTGWAPSDGINFQQSDAAIGIWLGDGYEGFFANDFLIGSQSSSYTGFATRNQGAGRVYFYNNATGGIYTEPSLTDVFLVASNTGHVRMYVDGVFVATSSTGNTTRSNQDLNIFCLNKSGTKTSYSDNNTSIWLAFCGSSSLSELGVYTCFSNYISDLGY
jgi:hypothetical protein